MRAISNPLLSARCFGIVWPVHLSSSYTLCFQPEKPKDAHYLSLIQPQDCGKGENPVLWSQPEIPCWGTVELMAGNHRHGYWSFSFPTWTLRKLFLRDIPTETLTQSQCAHTGSNSLNSNHRLNHALPLHGVTLLEADRHLNVFTATWWHKKKQEEKKWNKNNKNHLLHKELIVLSLGSFFEMSTTFSSL